MEITHLRSIIWRIVVYDGCHFDENSTSNHHDISFARCAANNFGAKASNVILTGETGGHFLLAATEA